MGGGPGHFGQSYTKYYPKKAGSLQSARQRGVRGTVRGVRGMRGTQKIKKNIYLKILKKYKISKNAEIVWLVGFF